MSETGVCEDCGSSGRLRTEIACASSCYGWCCRKKICYDECTYACEHCGGKLVIKQYGWLPDNLWCTHCQKNIELKSVWYGITYVEWESRMHDGEPTHVYVNGVKQGYYDGDSE